ncbi:DNA topoisomerase IB [Sphingobacterium pedocola]|uniref:DNA topoisomerase n=1 Tax=Sphingobacterium pedocola TaxID=2082722 RepID=A0ABR9TCN7_9SPHI|nr:DNA topoisomerase IB [Sphingobacterium pedocola]MBE8723089.1 DNA topoisomerase I [Sphingobacterium pedocola]
MHLQHKQDSALKLKYVRADAEGYRRLRNKNGFFYVDSEGKKIKDTEILSYIESLVLPPAWEDVWISMEQNGHLLATGIDALGRKQYRYHTKWMQIRNLKKFEKLYDFGSALPKLKRRLKKDLRKRTFIKDKITATAILVMSETYLRAGNTLYEQKYGSYGLTTLKNKHVNIVGSKAFFKFTGKKSVQQNIVLTNSGLVRVLKKIKELPGQKLFQYYDSEGCIQQLDSGNVNQYIQTYMNGDFSCKDFRTWAGCCMALLCMIDTETGKIKDPTHKNLVGIIDEVANKLGNTRNITRNYYIHPQLQQDFLDNKLNKHINRLINRIKKGKQPTESAEQIFMSYLKENGTVNYQKSARP